MLGQGGPAPIEEAELYDGPRPNGGRPPLEPALSEGALPEPARPPAMGLADLPELPKSPRPSRAPVPQSGYPQLLTLALEVLSARLLGFLALATACLIWGLVSWDPSPWRIVAAGVFSAMVFIPTMVLYWRTG